MTLDNVGLVIYNNHRNNKEVIAMTRKKERGVRDNALQAIVLITAFRNLVGGLIGLIEKLSE